MGFFRNVTGNRFISKRVFVGVSMRVDISVISLHTFVAFDPCGTFPTGDLVSIC